MTMKLSTEVLEAGGAWRQTGPLPSARTELRAAVLNNNIFVFGDNIFRYVILVLIIEHLIKGSKDILKYNISYHTWEKVGGLSPPT